MNIVSYILYIMLYMTPTLLDSLLFKMASRFVDIFISRRLTTNNTILLLKPNIFISLLLRKPANTGLRNFSSETGHMSGLRNMSGLRDKGHFVNWSRSVYS